jgi:hypothetical protein
MAFARDRVAEAKSRLPWNRPEAPKGPGSSSPSSLITQPQKSFATTPAQPASLIGRKPAPEPHWNGAYAPPPRSLASRGLTPAVPTPGQKRGLLGGS